ncbi:hypothetical protein Cob_v001458 [Colletotrichum orbiculare MAFF 240422]|uniref:Uncharacterized protein n=1 Tax=Colletotrichum orbiculare (strain 104-T / ATCC 96160 / CBS 514.97 / LARS 414 / MAFF 240422) TaxID=1213857 RepID=A0A484G7R6_COLOR|nr:hypothetical protein Cob_v001458 [Colletotrichum orbiculare MAFF 240422]
MAKEKHKAERPRNPATYCVPNTGTSPSCFFESPLKLHNHNHCTSSSTRTYCNVLCFASSARPVTGASPSPPPLPADTSRFGGLAVTVFPSLRLPTNATDVRSTVLERGSL